MPMPIPGKRVALIIGINAYSNGVPPLSTPVADARRLAEMLRDRHGYDVLLLDDATALARIREVMVGVLPAKVPNPEDRLLVYFAGHGISIDGDDGPEGYLLPQDAVRDDPSTFLPMIEFQEALDRLSCRHLLVILDCCFAGSFRWANNRNVSAKPSVLYRQRFERYLRGRAWQAIASASHRQQALDVLARGGFGSRDGRDNHSPFAAAVFAALEGKADLYPPAAEGKPCGDGVITVTELFTYVREQVADCAESQFHNQTPVFWPLKRHEDGEFIFLAPGREPTLAEAPPLTRENNPYRGLEAYDTTHKDLFAGRAAVTADLIRKVEADALTIVTGASGTGKSSVVRAGLIPEFETQGWTVLAPLRPSKSPISYLAMWAAGSGLTKGSDPKLELQADPAGLANWCRDWVSAHPESNLMVVIDQLEELVTLCLDASDRDAFLAAVAGLVAEAGERIRVILTVRSDFEGQFRGKPFGVLWDRARFAIPPLTQDDYREIITAPASARAVFFESSELIENLVNEVVQMPGGLPLLSFTLSEMYLHYIERSEDDRCLTWVDYEAVGGVVASLRNRMDRLYEKELGAGAGQETPEQRTLRRVMLRMMSTEGGVLARRRVPRDEMLYPSEDENQRVETVLEKLMAARLVVADRDAEGRPVVEPAHDALVNGWDRLLRWTREDQEQLALRRLLTPAAADWKAGQGGLWWANPRLPVLVRITLCDTGWLNSDESKFVEKSESKRLRNMRWVVGITATAFLILSSLMVFAIFQRNAARTNEQIADEKTKLANHQLKQTTQQLYTVRISQLNQAWKQGQYEDLPRLLEAADLSHDGIRLSGFEWELFRRVSTAHTVVTPPIEKRERLSQLRTFALSPDDKVILFAFRPFLVAVDFKTFSESGVGLITEIQRLAKENSNPQTVSQKAADIPGIIRILHQGRVDVLAYSPNGRYIAAVGDQTSIVYETESWKEHKLSPNGGWTTVSFNEDSSQLAAGRFDGEIKLFQVPVFNLMHSLKAHEKRVTSVAFRFSFKDSYELFSASLDGTLRFWKGKGSRAQATIVDSRPIPINCVKTNRTSKLVLSTCDDGIVRLYSDMMGDITHNRDIFHDDEVWAAAISDRAGMIATGSRDGKIQLTWLDTVAIPRVVDSVPVYNSRDLILVNSVEPFPEGVVKLSFTSNANAFISLSRFGRIRLVNIDRLRVNVSPKWAGHSTTHNSPVSAVRFSDDGEQLFSFDSRSQYKSSRKEGVWSGFSSVGGDSPFHPVEVRMGEQNGDGYWMLVTPDEATRIDQAMRSAPRQTVTTSRVSSLAFTASGREFYLGYTDGQIHHFDGNGQVRKIDRAHNGTVRALEAIPAQGVIVSAGDDGSFKVWEIATLDLVTELRAHTQRVNRLLATSDGSRLFSAADDGIIRIWDTSSWNPLLNLQGHSAAVTTLALSKASNDLASGGADRNVTFWQANDR